MCLDGIMCSGKNYSVVSDIDLGWVVWCNMDSRVMVGVSSLEIHAVPLDTLRLRLSTQFPRRGGGGVPMRSLVVDAGHWRQATSYWLARSGGKREKKNNIS